MNGTPPPSVTKFLVFEDFLQAARCGFYTKTNWKKKNRKPCAESSAIVVTKKGKDCWPTYLPVLQVVSPNIVVVAMDFYFVFSFHETEVLSSMRQTRRVREVEGENSVKKTPDPDPSSYKNTLPPSPPSLPYDVKNDTSSSPTRRSVNLPKAVVFDENHYLPEGLSLDDLPPKVKDGVGYLVHLIYHRRVMERLGVDDFIPLKAQYLRKIIPLWKSVKEVALERGIVECDFHYIKGEKSYGYGSSSRRDCLPGGPIRNCRGLDGAGDRVERQCGRLP